MQVYSTHTICAKRCIVLINSKMLCINMSDWNGFTDVTNLKPRKMFPCARNVFGVIHMGFGASPKPAVLYAQQKSVVIVRCCGARNTRRHPRCLRRRMCSCLRRRKRGYDHQDTTFLLCNERISYEIA